MIVKYAIITPISLSKLKMPEGWSKSDFKEFYRHGIKLYSIMAFESGIINVKDKFLKIFDAIEDFNEWIKSDIDIVKTQYDNINNKVSILCDNGFVYSAECLTSWSKQDCINFINTIFFEDSMIYVLPKDKINQYKESLGLIDSDIYWDQGFSLYNHRFCTFKSNLQEDDIDFIINEFNLENNLKITEKFIFESCFEYYKYWKNSIII